MKVANGKIASPLVLIVDDDLTTTMVLEGLLQGSGFETLSASDLATAETLVNLNSISLILLDVHLPDGNGLDLCKRLVETPATAGIPILFISADDDVETKVKGFAVGGVDYIAKPLRGSEVLARVRTHIRLRLAYESLAELQMEKIQRLASSQQMLMPQPDNLPEAGFRVCMQQALLAGGDFYDVFQSGNKITDYVVADASGHDLGVSLWTASFKTLLSEYASILHTPQDTYRMINNSLRKMLPEGAYFTSIYARLNRASNKLILVNAGHPSAVLVSAKSRVASVLQQEGDLIGIFPDAVFGVMELSVLPGDRLFLYSDGLIEMGLNREEGIGRLKSACEDTLDRPMEEALSLIVKSMSDGVVPEDDVVLMGVSV